MLLMALLIGLLAGYWARDIHDKVLAMYEYLKDRLESPAGVVKPVGRRVTRSQQPDDSETGSVMRPRPDDLAIRSMAAREAAVTEKVRDLSI